MSTSFTGKRYAFPDALFNVDAIASIIKMYQLFRADLQVDVRCTSSIYHQGLLQMSWMPCINSSAHEVYRWSAGDPIDLSFSTQQCATLCVPYTSPIPWINPALIAGTYLGQIGQVSLDLITPYRNTEGTTDFTVSVYARFVEPRVARPLPVTTTIFPSHQSQAPDSSTSSMVEQPKSAAAKPQFDLESFLKTTSNSMITQTHNSPLSPILSVVDTIAGVGESLIGSMLTGLDKPTSVQSACLMTPVFGRDTPYTVGVDQSVRLSQYPTSKLGSVKIFPGSTSAMQVADVAKTPMLWGVYNLNQSSSPTTSFSFKVHPLEAGTMPTSQVDYLGYVSRAYTKYRGSIRYRMKFVCSSFYKTRVRISQQYQTTPAIGNPGDMWSRIVEVNGDTEVKFCTPFLYPRFWDSTYVMSGDTPQIVVELIDSITGAPSGQTPNIDIAVWRAAGWDYQLADLHFAHYPISPRRKKQKDFPSHQTSLRQAFSKKEEFDALCCETILAAEIGFCTGEIAGTVQDAMRRYGDGVNWFSNDSEMAFLPPMIETVSPGQLFALDGVVDGTIFQEIGNPFYWFILLYWYWRGDYRLKYLLPQANVDPGIVFASLLQEGHLAFANAATWTAMSMSPELQMEIPFSAGYPYFQVQGPSAITYPGGTLIEPSCRPPLIGFDAEFSAPIRLLAAGENFLCGMLAPPPLLPASQQRTASKMPVLSLSRTVTEKSLEDQLAELKAFKIRMVQSKKDKKS